MFLAIIWKNRVNIFLGLMFFFCSFCNYHNFKVFFFHKIKILKKILLTKKTTLALFEFFSKKNHDIKKKKIVREIEKLQKCLLLTQASHFMPPKR